MKKILLAVAAIGLAVPVAPALAGPPPWAPAHGYRAKQQQAYDGYNRYNSYQPQYRYADNGMQYWQGDDGRYYCKRSNGTVGLVVGGVAGALVGRAIDTQGSRTTGTILGAAAGALLGRQVQKSMTCR